MKLVPGPLLASTIQFVAWAAVARQAASANVGRKVLKVFEADGVMASSLWETAGVLPPVRGGVNHVSLHPYVSRSRLLRPFFCAFLAHLGVCGRLIPAYAAVRSSSFADLPRHVAELADVRDRLAWNRHHAGASGAVPCARARRETPPCRGRARRRDARRRRRGGSSRLSLPATSRPTSTGRRKRARP